MKKENLVISNKDPNKYELISEIIFKNFTYEGKSILKGSDYRINKTTKVWFINFAPINKIEQVIKNTRYAIYPSENMSEIFYYNGTGDKEAIESRYNKFKENQEDEILVFAKFKDNSKYKGYKFLGVYKFDKIINNELENLLFKLVSDEYIFNNN